MLQYVRLPSPPGSNSPAVTEYFLELDSAGRATRELGLDAHGEIVYRFVASEHRHLVGEFYDNPILAPGVHSQSIMALAMEELSARLVEPAEFEILWRRGAD